jgi:DNA-binding CsgD family transcriptional regulator
MHDDEWSAPTWLVKIGLRVAKLVASESVRERFLQELRAWRQDHLRRDGRRDNPVEIMPARRLTGAEQFAVMAAVHDAVLKDVRPIDPWRTDKPLKRVGFPRAYAGLSFAVLRNEVRELSRRAHQERLEDALSYVTTELGAACDAPAVPSGAAGTDGRRAGARAESGKGLLALLYGRGEVPVLDLLTTPGNDTLLHDADCAGLVEFGTKGGWVWGTRAGAQWKPWPELVRELKAARDRALCVRLTAAGREHVGRLRLGLVESKSPATPKPAAKPKAGAAKPKRRRNRAKRLPRTEPTQREAQVIDLLSRRWTYPQIGEELGISKARVGQLKQSAEQRGSAPSRSVSARRALPPQV